jgi:hypothetical protein
MAKKNRLSLINLLKENVDEDYPKTLTDNEIFIMDYLSNEVDPSLLYEAEVAYENFNPIMMSKIVAKIFDPILTYIGMKNKKNDRRLLQYVLCYSENEGKEITTSTPIRRLAYYNFTIWDTTRQIIYNKNNISEVPAFSDEDMEEKKESLVKNMWDGWNTDVSDSDYGDSEFIEYSDASFDKDYVDYLVL